MPLLRSPRSFLIALVCTLALISSGIAQATLLDRGGGLIYDTDLNITWLGDANYGAGSIYDDGTIDRPSTTDGRMTWNNALAWAANLTYFDNVRGVTYSDWRLPTTTVPDSSCSIENYNCIASEMGHLFYQELGGQAKQSILTSTDPDLALFKNIQEADYWSSTPFGTEFRGPWAFGFFSGIQSTDPANFAEYAWAVRNGDVVPEPSTWLLLGSGLIGLLLWRRRQRTVH